MKTREYVSQTIFYSLALALLLMFYSGVAYWTFKVFIGPAFDVTTPNFWMFFVCQSAAYLAFEPIRMCGAWLKTTSEKP